MESFAIEFALLASTDAAHLVSEVARMPGVVAAILDGTTLTVLANGPLAEARVTHHVERLLAPPVFPA